MSDRHRLLMAQNLLKEAARLYEKHEAGRPEPFNVFSVLRSESDEVNLHSRFLHALLNYKKPGEKTRANLADFLQRVDIKGFDQNDVKVEREPYRIDIGIINGVGQAIVIENKIKAVDQPKQLLRYHDELKRRGYCKIHLLYLTLDGHSPSEDSVGDLDCEKVSCISYEHTLPRWLKRCQLRACDEPGLRESVAQYLQLTQKLTGTDFKEAYMKEMTKLCLQDNKLVLVHDLNEAMFRARVQLLRKLWDEIDSALKAEIPNLPPKDKDGKNDAYSVSNERIKRFLTPWGRDTYHGLFYTFGRGVASLCVEAGNGERLFFGVRCRKKHEDERRKLDEELENVPGESRLEWWPRYQEDDWNLKNPSRDKLKMLSNEADRKEHAKIIAQRLEPFWKAVKVADLA